jgi:glycosyltransferase involved in cell wall biosynthesis
VLLEAMAAGLPVVATAVGGTPELVVNGETGLLVPPGSSAALARGIVSVLRYPDWARTLGANGRARIAERFTVLHMVRRFESLYDELLGRSGPPDRSRTASRDSSPSTSTEP